MDWLDEITDAVVETAFVSDVELAEREVSVISLIEIVSHVPWPYIDGDQRSL